MTFCPLPQNHVPQIAVRLNKNLQQDYEDGSLHFSIMDGMRKEMTSATRKDVFDGRWHHLLWEVAVPLLPPACCGCLLPPCLENPLQQAAPLATLQNPPMPS